MARERTRPTAVIVDLDGTLCDVRGVEHFVTGAGRRDFDAFHDGSMECPPHQAVMDAIDDARAEGHVVVIVTARNEKWAFLTALWLRENGIEYDDMFMRGGRDQRPDAEVKSDIAERLVRRYDPILAIDDRPEIIEVWHRFGIPTRHVNDSGEVGPVVIPAIR